MDRATLGYLAGLIDADGHIGWRGGRYQAPDVGVTNQSFELMEWLVNIVGGAYSTERRSCQPDCTEDHSIHRRSDICRWHVTGERACILLRGIRPHLVVKGARADDVLERYAAHLAIMERPTRRRWQMNQERAAMAAKGWD